MLLYVCCVFSLTLEVPAKNKVCIYDEVGVGNKVGFKVEVLSGGKKDLIFSIVSVGREEEIYNEELGDKMMIQPFVIETNFHFPFFSEYRFCFDNRYGTPFAKIVRIDFTNLESYTFIDPNASTSSLIQDRDVQQFSNTLTTIQNQAEEIRIRQVEFKSTETQRRNGLSSLHFSVYFSIFIQIALFLVFAVLQVYMIKRRLTLTP